MTPTIVRPYAAADRAAVRHVCFATGYMGSMNLQWRDAESFANVFSAYYTDREPQSLLIAANGEKVVGYLFGCRDTRTSDDVAAAVAREVRTRAIALRPGTARFVWRALGDSLAGAIRRNLPPARFVDPRWPAHLHINLLPEARRTGIGTSLVQRWVNTLTAAQSPGCHLQTLAENTAAIAFFESMGFAREGEPQPTPGLRAPDGSRHHVQLMVQSFEATPT